MFFYISGMSATFFNAEKHGFCVFIKGKVKRLLAPLFLSILFFLIPRLYLSQDYEAWTRVNNEIESNFFVYAIKVLPSIHTKLSWLWFLVVLFIVMLLNYPLIAWTQRRANKKQLEFKVDGKIVGMQIITLLVWILPCALIVDAKDAANYLIPSISVLGLFYAAIFSIQVLI